jgi:hypothetical protein
VPQYRADLKKKLLEVADSMPLAAGMPGTLEKKVCAFVRETVRTLLTN